MTNPQPRPDGENRDFSVFEKISSICQSYSEEISVRGAKPDIEHFRQYVKQFDVDSQPSLFRNFLHLEIERRRKAREQPGPEDYLDAFPGLEMLVHQVFQESTAISGALEKTHNPQQGRAQTVDHAPLPAKFLGEFELLRKLGEGGMGEVYQARHLSRGDHVAMKMLRIRPENAHDTLEDISRLRKFKNEFRALADINHRHLVGLHTLEEDGGQYFFTMDLIDGEDFLSHVRPDKKLSEQRLRAALSQLVAGVMALHRYNIVHRDLKPNNVMVDREDQVKILDFGLVVDLAQNVGATTTVNFQGTPAYAAPEQANGQQTFASDWYAVGVMLYEALVGRWPYRGRSAMQILKDKQEQDAESIVGQANVPDDLARLCMRLISRDPRQRPQANEIAEIVSAEVTLPKPVAETEHALIGRDSQLAALRDAYQFLVDQQQPLTVFVSGRSGEGKSFLVEHFLEPLQKDKSLTILSGRCYDRESVPFKALDRLIDALSSHLESLPEMQAALLMPDDISFLAHLFPVMKRVKVVAESSQQNVSKLDEQQVRQRAYAALRLLLGRISGKRPILMFIDDLQWGDADSAEVMFQVLRPPEPPALLFLGSYRSDEAAGSPFLQAWSDHQRKNNIEISRRDVKVGPLSAEECAELVAREKGEAWKRMQDRAEELFQDAGGNPYLLTELMDSFDPDGGELRQIPLAEMIQRKLRNLPPEAEGLLDIIAVSGQALTLAEASKAAGRGAPAVSTITHMRTEKLVRLVGAEENPQVDTYHDKIRETVLSGMEPTTRAATHLILANTIEADAQKELEELLATLENDEFAEQAHPRLYDLAYHFDGGGAKSKAWRYALLAAEQSRRQFALEVSVEQYGIAKRNLQQTSRAVRYRIAEGLGESLMLIGNYDEAEKQLEGAVDLVEEPVDKARIEALQGEIALKQGAINRSIGFYEQGLRRLGVRIPKTRLGLGYHILRESVIQCAHSFFPKSLHKKPLSSQLDLTIRLLNRLNMPYVFSNTLKAVWAQLAGMNRAELAPPSLGLVFSHALHSAYMAMLGWTGRGAPYRERAKDLAQKFDDIWGYGQCCNFHGIGLHASARYEEGIAASTEAIDAFQKAGDLWELHLAYFHRACCHFGLGNLAEAIADARHTFHSSARLGDTRTMCSSWLWARATNGDIPFEELQSCYPCRPDDIMSTVHSLLAEGSWHTFHGRSEQALQVIERAAVMVKTTFCVNSHTILVVPMLARALRLRANAVQCHDSRQFTQLRKRALRSAKWAVRLSRFFPAVRPLALHERSLILADCGKTKQALSAAQESCSVAEQQNAKYEYAQSLLVRGRLAAQLGRSEAEALIQTAEEKLAAFASTVRGLGA